MLNSVGAAGETAGDECAAALVVWADSAILCSAHIPEPGMVQSNIKVKNVAKKCIARVLWFGPAGCQFSLSDRAFSA